MGQAMTRLLARIPPSLYVLATLAALAAWQLTPRTADPVNPDVFDSVRSIVKLCEAGGADTPQEAERCRDVNYLVQWCTTRGKGMCTLERFYDTMVTLGFRLPPLHPEPQ